MNKRIYLEVIFSLSIFISYFKIDERPYLSSVDSSKSFTNLVELI